MMTLPNLTVPALRGVGGSALSPVSIALCNYLANHGSTAFEVLYDVFGTAPRNPHNLNAFRKRLANLQVAGHLQAISGGKGNTRLWQLASSTPTVRTALPLQPSAPTPPAGAGDARPTSVATPVCYDLQRAPAYVPPPREAVRAGADDFLRCASHGQRC